MSKKRRRINKVIENKQLTNIIQVLEKVRQNEFVLRSEVFTEDFGKIIDRLRDDSFRLAVVGEFSSGKSTFLNALIGRDILKHGAQETTATITEIYNDGLKTDKTSFDVYYVNGDIKKDVPLNEITEFTATTSESYLVAQEIEKVVIRSRILDNDSKVCFVDTPGLNGIADNHREKTIEQIKNAHACIYLMQVRGLGQSDIDFLKYICKYQHNIIFVQNFIDELKKLEGETPEQKMAEQKKIIEEKILNSEKDVRYSIVAISARKALTAKSNEFNSYNGEVLTEEICNRLYEESRFEDVINAINKLMVDNEKEKIKVKDASVVAINLLKQLKSIVTFENEKEREEWEHSVEGINKKNYEKLIQLLEENRDLYIKKLDDYIESETADIRRECKKKLFKQLENLERKIKDIFIDISEIDVLEKYVENTLAGYIYSNVTDIEDYSIRQLNISFENLICNAVLRIKQYTGTGGLNIELPEFETKKIDIDIKDFTKEENEITQIERNLREKKKFNEKYSLEEDKIIKENKQLVEELSQKNSKLSSINRTKLSEIDKLGSMPKRETKYKKKVYYEDHGGLGIMDFFFGPKRVEKQVEYYDYSKQEEWKKKKSDIETKYLEEENKINAQCRVLETKKRQNDEELKHIKDTDDMRKKEIISMEKHLETKQNYLLVQREKVKQEYLKEAKSEILGSIHEYLCEKIYGLLGDNLEQTVIDNKVETTKIIKSLFDLSFNKRIKSLNMLLNENIITTGIEDTDKFLTVINQSIKELEVYLCKK